MVKILFKRPTLTQSDAYEQDACTTELESDENTAVALLCKYLYSELYFH